MIRRSLLSLAFVALLSAAAPASAQTVGTFRWQLQPYGSVLNLTVVQQGSLFLLSGFESQCSNASLPVSGVAIPQPNGLIFLGVTSITELGQGLHTRAFVNPTDNFNGSWSDNANNTNQPFFFNPGETCPGGPRTGPTMPDQEALAAMQAELASLRARVAAAEGKKQ